MPYAPVNINTAVTTEIVAAPGAGKRVRVLGFWLVAAAAQTWKLKTATTDLFPACTMTAGQPHSAGPNYDGLGLDCNLNEALQITTTTTGQLSGWVFYTLVGG
jgi:hypothetical protein